MVALSILISHMRGKGECRKRRFASGILLACVLVADGVLEICFDLLGNLEATADRNAGKQMMRIIFTTLPLALNLILPSSSYASNGEDLPASAPLSLYWILPFVLMLLSIAVLPLCLSSWWEKNSNKMLVSLALGLPVFVYFAFVFPYGVHHLLHTGAEYVSFVILLASLFVISGGIFLGGDIRATPLVNCAYLVIGSLLASVMGTTGAATALIRPLLNTNAERTNVVHTVIFFIFLVGNIGGALTPIGDPPLFMGYLYGVPFTWTLGLWPQWLLSIAVVLAVYFVWDNVLYRREPLAALRRDETEVEPLYLEGRLNILLLLGVVLAVALVPKSPHREIIVVVLSLISLACTTRAVREKNRFTFHPIVEVAILFFGIFLTMIPALYLLRTRGAELGVDAPWEFFWATGVLSAFLDNTPTYVVFFNLAQSLNLSQEIVGMSAQVLTAISLGAVFFGAVTYIGNAPNFMIKAIAEERGLKMPSFFGYMVYSVCVLLPLFVLVSLIWFGAPPR